MTADFNFIYYRDSFSAAKTLNEKIKIVTDYYKEYEHQIINLNKKNKRLFFNPDIFDWPSIFTPIEYDTWCEIRYQAIPLYPQYPVLNYRLDFANPYLKIGLEIDGKDFHNKEKDTIRDLRLFNEAGYKIFRVTGSEAYKILELPDSDFKEEYKEVNSTRLQTTISGVITSLKEVYFRNTESKDYDFTYECYRCLSSHKLAGFDL